MATEAQTCAIGIFANRRNAQKSTGPHKPPISPSLTTIYNLFMQNEPNFRKSQMNVSSFITSKYEKMDIWWGGKNKANSKPNKANFKTEVRR